jgi:hypothetical protein
MRMTSAPRLKEYPRLYICDRRLLGLKSFGQGCVCVERRYLQVSKGRCKTQCIPYHLTRRPRPHGRLGVNTNRFRL